VKSQEAPKIVNASIWTAAIIGVLVFAVSLTTYFFGFLDNQISADTEDTLSDQPSQCPEGKMAIAINNYPGRENLIDGKHNEYWLSNSDMNFRCSHICVDINEKLSSESATLSIEANSEEKTLSANLSSLEGATTGQGQPLISFASSDKFNEAIKKGGEDREKAIKYGFIVDKIRVVKGENTGCLGPNSVPYDEILDKDGKKITTLYRRPTAYTGSATTGEDDVVAGEPATESAPERDLTGASKPADAPRPFGAPTGSGGEADTKGDNDTTNTQLQECMKSIEDFIKKYSGVYKPTAFHYLAHYKYIQSKYKGLKGKVANNRDPEMALRACQLLKSQTVNFSSTKESSADNQKESMNTNADITLTVGLKYGGRDRVNADTWIAIYPSKNGFFDGTKPVPRPTSDPILTYKYKKGASNPLTLSVVAKTPLPDKLAVYAVTTGGFLSSERWGAQIIDFESQKVMVNMDKKTGQRMTQGRYSIYYVSYKILENTRN